MDKEQFKSEWVEAVRDAQDYVDRQSSGSPGDEAKDDARYLHDTLQRFVNFFQLDPADEPTELVRQVREAKITGQLAKCFGKTLRPSATNLEVFRKVVAKYLSTEDIYWTIVESCEVCGPFEGWHPKLSLVDLPGTNDVNAQRTSVTDSLKGHAQAVAIVTGESNLGVDIESWLQNSRVLSDFLEAKDAHRQRLFIIRSKLDNYHPDIGDELPDSADEATEERILRERMATYKIEQAETYHSMLRGIVTPRLSAMDYVSQQKRKDLIGRVTGIPVFFVAAQAHEAFTGRIRLGPRTVRRLKEQFGDDLDGTGVPVLRDYLNEIAADYLAKNYYDDIESRLESEAGQLAQYFRQQASTVEAELAGAGQSINALATHVRGEVLPWIQDEVRSHVNDFEQSGTVGGREIRHRLDQIWSMSERRFRDKTDKWSNYAWNSLRATARKRGAHTTCHGHHIDITQDICSVLVDDLVLAWTSYRDQLIQERISVLTDDFARQLQDKLEDSRIVTQQSEAKEAIAQIIEQLRTITHGQRLELLREVSTQIDKIESIQQPAYDYIQHVMEPVFAQISRERGTGCQQRMRDALLRGFQSHIDDIRRYISQLVDHSVSGLLHSCSSAFSQFGDIATQRIEKSLDTLSEAQRLVNQEELGRRRALIGRAILCLPLYTDSDDSKTET